MSDYIYIKTEPQLWTVGFYHGEQFEPESDWSRPQLAAVRVRYLNGGDLSEEERKDMEKEI